MDLGLFPEDQRICDPTWIDICGELYELDENGNKGSAGIGRVREQLLLSMSAMVAMVGRLATLSWTHSNSGFDSIKPNMDRLE